MHVSVQLPVTPPTISVEETTEQPTEPFQPTEYLPDERPSAIAFGGFSIIIVTSLIAFFIILDLPTYKQNLRVAKNNINSYINYRRCQKQAKVSVALKNNDYKQLYEKQYPIQCAIQHSSLQRNGQKAYVTSETSF